LARAGIPVRFISETGNDRIGNIILKFMQDNGIATNYINVFPDGKSPVSLAFLNAQSDAEYIFYKDYPKQRLDILFPELEENDILIFGSYYALNPVLRDKIVDLLEQAREKKVIIYYDLNFRSSHKEEALKLMPTIIENFEYSSIVRGSIEDFLNLYNLKETDKIYKDKIKFYCPNFILTSGADNISLHTQQFTKEYPAMPLNPVSTIGAGDNFNAGVIYGLLKHQIQYDDLNQLDETTWKQIIHYGIAFSANVCQSFSNSISSDFAKQLSPIN
ncbi:MAG: carbohydrate kinase, partial [Bacteroides sp.]|jgi:fructokinase|nr:carbohydrate kinase [Bacteroides sp.]